MTGRFISDLHHFADVNRDFRQTDPAALLGGDSGPNR